MIKGIEVKKFAPDSSTTGSAKIKEFQTKMEEMTKRLKDLKAKNANRRKTAYTQDSQKLVKQAEELAGQAAKIVELFGEEGSWRRPPRTRSAPPRRTWPRPRRMPGLPQMRLSVPS
ncbi:unnamed protein product [Effrenium voratum]|nr:unnamed protein product [Effrenium voratum]